jgi:hypothetical protein
MTLWSRMNLLTIAAVFDLVLVVVNAIILETID